MSLTAQQLAAVQARLMARKGAAPWAVNKDELTSAISTYAQGLNVAELQLEGRLPVDQRGKLTATQKRLIGLEILKEVTGG